MAHESMSDTALLLRARSADVHALETLWARHHGAAVAAARALASAAGADDDAAPDDWEAIEAARLDELVADAFTSVFRRLRRGQTLDRGFRDALFRALRQAAAPRETAPVPAAVSTPDGESLALAALDDARARVVEIDSPELLGALRSGPINQAYRRLPLAQQIALWHALVDPTPLPRQCAISDVDAASLTDAVDDAISALEQEWQAEAPEQAAAPRDHLAHVLLPLALGGSAAVTYLAMRAEVVDALAPALPPEIVDAVRGAGTMSKPWSAIGIGVLAFAVAGGLFATFAIEPHVADPVASAEEAARDGLFIADARVVDAEAGEIALTVHGRSGRTVAIHARDDAPSGGAGGGMSAATSALGPVLAEARLSDNGIGELTVSLDDDAVRDNAVLAFVYRGSAESPLSYSLERLGLLEQLLRALGADDELLEKLQKEDSEDDTLDEFDPDAEPPRTTTEAGSAPGADDTGSAPIGGADTSPGGAQTPTQPGGGGTTAPSDPAQPSPTTPDAPARPESPSAAPAPAPSQPAPKPSQPAPSPSQPSQPAPSQPSQPAPPPAPKPVPTSAPEIVSATLARPGVLGLLAPAYDFHVRGMPGERVEVTTSVGHSATVTIGANGHAVAPALRVATALTGSVRASYPDHDLGRSFALTLFI